MKITICDKYGLQQKRLASTSTQCNLKTAANYLLGIEPTHFQAECSLISQWSTNFKSLHAS